MNSQIKMLSLTLAAAATLGLAVAGCDSSTHEVAESSSLTSMSLDDQNLQNAAREIAEKIMTGPRVQQAIRDIKAANGGRNPRLYISRIENRSGTHINMVEAIVAPMQETFTNNGTFDFESANEDAAGVAAQREAEEHRDPTKADLVLDGYVSLNSTYDNGVEQNSYHFDVKLTDTRTNVVVFTGLAKTPPKQKKRSGFGM